MSIMQPTPPKGNPIGIYYTGAIKAARQMADDYNLQHYDALTGKYKLSKCIRAPHMQLMESLLRFLGKKSYVTRAHGELPELNIRRCDVAKVLMCTDRTVTNLMNRLEEAQMIKKTFRGSKFSLLIEIHPSILVTRERMNAYTIEQDAKNAEIDEAKQSLTTILRRKSFPNIIHTLKTNNSILTKEVEKLKTSIDQRTSGNFSPKLDLETSSNRKTHPSRGDLEKEPPVAAAPLEEPRLSHADFGRVHSYTMKLWAYAYSRFYHKYKFISSSEVLAAMVYFAKGLMHTRDKDRWAKKTSEMLYRMELVAKWLERDPSRYVPLPSVYFNVNNPHGFSSTRHWLKARKELEELKKETNIKSRMYHHVYGEMMRVYSDFEPNRIASYQKSIAKIESYQPEMVKGFLNFHYEYLKNQNHVRN